MRSVLNGTGWGEAPTKRELEIPIFLTEEYREMERQIAVAEEALIAAGRAKEHRRQRKEAQKQMNAWAVTVFGLTLAFVLAFVGWLM